MGSFGYLVRCCGIFIHGLDLFGVDGGSLFWQRRMAAERLHWQMTGAIGNRPGFTFFGLLLSGDSQSLINSSCGWQQRGLFVSVSTAPGANPLSDGPFFVPNAAIWTCQWLFLPKPQIVTLLPALGAAGWMSPPRRRFQHCRLLAVGKGCC